MSILNKTLVLQRNLPVFMVSSIILNCTSIAKDGVLVVKHSQPFVPVIESIIVPWSVLDGLFTALYINLYHPSRLEFQMVLQHQFFALDMINAFSCMTSACHTCASVLLFPPL